MSFEIEREDSEENAVQKVDIKDIIAGGDKNKEEEKKEGDVVIDNKIDSLEKEQQPVEEIGED